MEALEVAHVGGGGMKRTTHTLRSEWSYTRTNVTTCGRKATAHLYRTGDNGALPIEVTCRTCIRMASKKAGEQ